jgi:UDP-N-acetylglucosamine 2-epimerase
MTAATKRVLLVFGTRPEAIKMCPLVHAIAAHPGLTPLVAVTGQHRGMLDQMLALFDVTPDADLDLHQPGQTLADIAARVLHDLPGVLEQLDPDLVVVQGDTTTTVAAAMAAAYHQLPVVHLEAGLRSGDRTAPFPEEINRRMVTQLARLHLTATEANRAALLAEAVPAADIAVTGNTVIDALLTITAQPRPFQNLILRQHLTPETLDKHPLVLVTAHRRESWGAPLTAIARAIAEVADQLPHARFVWPLHANPQVRDWVQPVLRDRANILLTDPLGYPDFTTLLAHAHTVVTDSGGVQEEAPALRVPVLVTRHVTEREEVIHLGAGQLVGPNQAAIRTALLRLLTDPAAHQGMRIGYSPYGDGAAATRAAAAIAALTRTGERLPDYTAPAQPAPPPARSRSPLVPVRGTAAKHPSLSTTAAETITTTGDAYLAEAARERQAISPIAVPNTCPMA